MDRIDTIRIFIRVAELSGFTAAAAEMGLPKASVSTAVRRLEEKLGVCLLHRTTRQVRITHDGHVFYERCKNLLADVDELYGLFEQGHEDLTGRLRVDMASGLVRSIVAPKLPAFLDAHPLLELELSGIDRRVDLVREGFDCVLRIGKLGDENLFARRLGLFRMLNCASPGYLSRYGTPETLDELTQHRMVHYLANPGGAPSGFEYPDGPGYSTLPMVGTLTVRDTESYESACLANLGIIQAPEPGMRHYLDTGQLVEVLPGLRAEPMPVSLLYAQSHHLPRRTRVFMDWLEDVLRPYLMAA